MKKVLLGFTVLAAIGLASCSKEKTCQCTTVQKMNGEVVSTSQTDYTTKDDCANLNSTTDMQGISSTVMTCSEK